MQIIDQLEAAYQASGTMAPLALVPTMGALHEGHLSLVRRAKELCPNVAVSIFVNPTQFGPNEDFDRYPRPLEKDLALCRAEGVDLVFCPTPQAMYPPGEAAVAIDVPAISGDLEGAHRPGHFAGVCRVVAKLLSLVQPQVACFGQKDYQQLRVIEAMVSDLCLPVAIEACPTLRDPDGLALSSRNVYLTDAQRPRALALHRALTGAQRDVDGGQRQANVIEQNMMRLLTDHRLEVDYACLRDARSLQPVQSVDRPVVCLIAARLGSVRLIDNLVIQPI